ncbi:MAG: tetratricopeptide repeat protein [Puniceicoccales bacterium]|jgi:tetratricopeptide (TPR) repeat protein|nr:tetratricopeptide repeat protein [Puniceicoccales bacterium]
MKISPISSVLGSMLFLCSWAQGNENAFYQGNTALQEAHVDQAIAHYQNAQKGGFSAATSAQLARCYEAKGEWGKALLHLERALHLDPGNAALRETRRQWWLRGPSCPSKALWTEKFGLPASGRCWAYVASLALWLLAILLACPRSAMPSTKRLRRALWMTDLFLWLALVPILHQLEEKNRQAILVRESPLRVAPTEKSPTLSPLLSGNYVYPQKQHEAFFYVTTRDGSRSGWVAAQDMEWIIPRSF